MTLPELVLAAVALPDLSVAVPDVLPPGAPLTTLPLLSEAAVLPLEPEFGDWKTPVLLCMVLAATIFPAAPMYAL